MWLYGQEVGTCVGIGMDVGTPEVWQGVAGGGRERQETVEWCQYWAGLYRNSFPPEIPRCAVCWSHVSCTTACPLV